MSINKAQLTQLLSQTGPISQFLKGYEVRTTQVQMMQDIIEAYNKGEIALIEAGTGIGKSLAYLLPAIFWYREHGERTVISTNTINLQEQLLYKDIPLITQALNIQCHAVLVKGMSNYLCLRKHQEMRYDLQLMSENDHQEWQKIEVWSEKTQEGSRSSLPFVPSAGMWEKVAAEQDTCNRSACPHYKECFYFKARRQASEAHILIVNHHLLCTDLIFQEENQRPNEGGILPVYTRVILDEAHNLEEIATDFFGSRFNQIKLLKTLAKLSAEKVGNEGGKLQNLKLSIHDYYRKDPPAEVLSIIQRLNHELLTLKWDVTHALQKSCDTFREFLSLFQVNKMTGEIIEGDFKLRLLPYHHQHPYWEKSVLPLATDLILTIEKYGQSLESVMKDLAELKNDKLLESLKNILFDIKALMMRLIEDKIILKNFLSTEVASDKVRWIDIQQSKIVPSTNLFHANLDISKDLATYLFKRFQTVVLVSATLTTNQHFKFIRQSLGLTPSLLGNKVVTEAQYLSPFDYQNQALLTVPINFPSPDQPNFMEVASKLILKTLKASRGNAFILFTSYSMLKNCYQFLEGPLRTQGFHPMKQGDTNRQKLILQFKESQRGVLFGTDSFWEGVDVVGEALRCVIIVKLPFKVPTEPILQARAEAIKAQGGDAFYDYSLPRAIVKFKQGFGRLIRHKKDRGCILCLDSRLLNKSYGKFFLKSLPPCSQFFASEEEILQKMQDFYKKTQNLTKS